MIDPRALRSGNQTDNRFAAPILRTQVPLLQLLFHLVDVRRWKIDLVDCYHDFHVGRGLGMINCFDRLRHDAVIGRHYQNNDVSDVRAARPHRGESGVAGRIDKSYFRFFVFNLIRADVLGNSTGFTRRHSRLADCVQQRSFAVIDVTHKSDDRTTRFEFLFLGDDRRRRRHHDLLDFVNAAALFAALFFQDEPVTLANL